MKECNKINADATGVNSMAFYQSLSLWKEVIAANIATMSSARLARAVLRVMEENYDITHFQYIYKEGSVAVMKFWTNPKDDDAIPLGSLPQHIQTISTGEITEASWLFSPEGVHTSSFQRYTTEISVAGDAEDIDNTGGPDDAAEGSGRDDGQSEAGSGAGTDQDPSDQGSNHSGQGEDIRENDSDDNDRSPARKQRRTRDVSPPSHQAISLDAPDTVEGPSHGGEASYENISAPSSPVAESSNLQAPSIGESPSGRATLSPEDIEDLLVFGRMQAVGRSSGGASRIQRARRGRPSPGGSGRTVVYMEDGSDEGPSGLQVNVREERRSSDA